MLFSLDLEASDRATCARCESGFACVVFKPRTSEKIDLVSMGMIKRNLLCLVKIIKIGKYDRIKLPKPVA